MFSIPPLPPSSLSLINLSIIIHKLVLICRHKLSSLFASSFSPLHWILYAKAHYCLRSAILLPVSSFLSSVSLFIPWPPEFKKYSTVSVSSSSSSSSSIARAEPDGTRAETTFPLSPKRTVHLNRRGSQFSRLLAAEVCASALLMLDTPGSEVV